VYGRGHVRGVEALRERRVLALEAREICEPNLCRLRRAVYLARAQRRWRSVRRASGRIENGTLCGQRFVATSTVETRRRNVMRELGTHSVPNLIEYALREGLMQADLRTNKRDSDAEFR